MPTPFSMSIPIDAITNQDEGLWNLAHMKQARKPWPLISLIRQVVPFTIFCGLFLFLPCHLLSSISNLQRFLLLQHSFIYRVSSSIPTFASIHRKPTSATENCLINSSILHNLPRPTTTWTQPPNSTHNPSNIHRYLRSTFFSPLRYRLYYLPT